MMSYGVCFTSVLLRSLVIFPILYGTDLFVSDHYSLMYFPLDFLGPYGTWVKRGPIWRSQFGGVSVVDVTRRI